MALRVDILANDGSPLNISCASIHGEDGRLGLGGAELSILTLLEGWHGQGHKVVFYNNATEGSPFEHKPMDAFSPKAPRDILIIFRSPTTRIRDGATGLKVWFSNDQRTVNDFKAFAPMVDKIVTISPYHSNYFENVYGIFDTIPIDLPVRTWEYEEEVEKVPYKCIWNSMPDRGALELAKVWKLIVDDFPEASLVLTSDWRLWDKNVPVDLLNPYKAAYASLSNVQYLGAVSRREMIKHQQESQLHLNVNKYEELFNISLAENQVAGAYPISSTTGAIRTTCMGTMIEGVTEDPAWQRLCADKVLELLNNQEKLEKLAKNVQEKAKERFALDRILKEWSEKVFS